MCIFMVTHGFCVFVAYNWSHLVGSHCHCWDRSFGPFGCRKSTTGPVERRRIKRQSETSTTASRFTRFRSFLALIWLFQAVSWPSVCRRCTGEAVGGCRLNRLLETTNLRPKRRQSSSIVANVLYVCWCIPHHVEWQLRTSTWPNRLSCTAIFMQFWHWAKVGTVVRIEEDEIPLSDVRFVWREWILCEGTRGAALIPLQVSQPVLI